MTLEPGTAFGSYEILAPLGAGGMGEVYRAKDKKLGREVAIKVLPERLSDEPERMARFEREAKVLASLNHTNIATLHGFETDADKQFLVMELVEGETLEERIKRGAIPVDQALPLFLQIAEGLEAAHEKGIIHRDLKPANIKVSDDGQVKILDFGLAKAMAADQATIDADPAQSPTLTHDFTHRGQIMGTAAYMSPEQATAGKVDRRTDIWAFGVALYEALSGQQLFKGNTVSEILAEVLKEGPDWDQLPSDTPSAIRRVLRRCLSRDVRLRLPHIGGARLDIGDAISAAGGVESGADIGSRAAPSWRLPALLTAAALAGAAAVAVVLLSTGATPPAATVSRATLDVPWVVSHSVKNFAIAPNGQHLVSAGLSEDGSTTQLYLRSLESFESVPIGNTQGALAPFFSADSEWVGFVADGEIKKIPRSGGVAISICNAPSPSGVNLYQGAVWQGDGFIYYGANGGILRVDENGGTPVFLFPPGVRTEDGRSYTRDGAPAESLGAGVPWPRPLPGGKAFLVSVPDPTWDDVHLTVLNIETGELTPLAEGGQASYYAPTGHVVYARDGVLRALPFDADTLQAKGPSVPILEGLGWSNAGRLGLFDLSQNGTLVYRPPITRSVVWVDADTGKAEPLPLDPMPVVSVDLSPDGTLAVLPVWFGTRKELWLYDLERRVAQKLAIGGRQNWSSAWAPDGRSLALGSSGGGFSSRIYRQPMDTSRTAELLLDEEWSSPGDWSPDSRHLGYWMQSDNSLFILQLDGEEEPWEFTEGEHAEYQLVFHPEGSWVAYTSYETGTAEIFVKRFPESDSKSQISTAGGTGPRWSADGRKLFYRKDRTVLEVAVVASSAELRAGSPRVLFEGDYSSGIFVPNYDVHPDGERFLMLQERTEDTEFRVVFNFFEELKRLVPTD